MMENNNSPTSFTSEAYTPPQVYSPLPIRTPVVGGVGFAFAEALSNSETNINDPDVEVAPKPRSNRFLLNKFNEVDTEDERNEKNIEDDRVNNEEKENTPFKNGVYFVRLQRPPVRVSNPQVNDENFVRQNNNIRLNLQKMGFFNDAQTLTEQEC
jgi:hypothetical protein